MKYGGLDNMDVFYILRNLHCIKMTDEEVTKFLIDYIVKKGYDSDDLMAMSSKRGGYRRAV